MAVPKKSVRKKKAPSAWRKCPKCEKTTFRVVRDSFNPGGVTFALLVCKNIKCASIVAGGPIVGAE